jgi:hypothetical protein
VPLAPNESRISAIAIAAGKIVSALSNGFEVADPERTLSPSSSIVVRAAAIKSITAKLVAN